MNLCAATLLVVLGIPGVVSAQSPVPSLDPPFPTRYSGMGFAGVAVCDPDYGMINPASVAAWVSEGWSVSFSQVELDGYPGHQRQTEAFGLRIPHLRVADRTVVSIAISHSRHHAEIESLPPYDPVGDERILISSLHDDYTVGFSLRYGIEVAGAMRWTHARSRARYSYDPERAFQSTSTGSSPGGLLRIRAGELLGHTGINACALRVGPIGVDGEAAYGGVQDNGDTKGGYTLAVFASIWNYPFVSARWVQDKNAGLTQKGWEIGVLGLAKFRGGRKDQSPDAIPAIRTTKGLAFSLGRVFRLIGDGHNGPLAWLISNSDITFAQSRYKDPRTLESTPIDFVWTAWSFSLGTAQPF